MATSFADTAMKKFAPAVQPKKQLAPGEDPDAPQPIKPLGAPPQPDDDMQPIGQLGAGASGMEKLFGGAPQPMPDIPNGGDPYGGKSQDEVLAIQRQENERNRNLNLQQDAGLAPTGAPSDFAPVLQGGGPLASPPVADVPKPPPTPTGPAEPVKPPPAPTGAPIALGDPNAPAPTAGATPAAGQAGPAAGQIYAPGQYPIEPPDFNKTNQDAPAQGMPGYVWHHNGTGWDLRPGSRVNEGPGGTPGAPAAPSLEDTLNKKMMDLMSRNEVPTRDDPAIAGALAANRLAGQRGTERNRAMLAEKMAREGGGADSGAMRTALMGLNESRAASEGQFAANTILDETRQRRDQLQSTLALAGNTLDARQKNQIQQELGRLNAEVQRYGISEGGRQHDADLQEKIREYGLDDVFRKAGLDASSSQASAARGESARQFDINQAQQQAQWEADFNRQQLLDMFGLMGY